MKTFTDTTGETWSVAVTYGDVVDVQKATGFYLPGIFDNDFADMGRLHDDFGLLVTVTAQLCAGQIEQRGLDAEEFARRLGGDSLAEAAEAVVGATIDFFPSPHRREAMRKVVRRLTTAGETLRAKVEPIADAQLQMALDQLSTGSSVSSGSAPVSQELSPGA